MGSASSSPHNFVSWNDGQFPVLFAAYKNGYGVELFLSDGTFGGTGLLKDINAGTRSSNPCYLTYFQEKVYFQVNFCCCDVY